MIGYIVQCKGDDVLYINQQGMKTDNKKHACIFSTEIDAIAIASVQNCDTVVLSHEYERVAGTDGTFFEYHRAINKGY
jgi:hypothetical protein